MTTERLQQFEDYIIKAEGNITHVKRVLHLCRILAEKEGIYYDEDILTFAAYFHDIAAYPYLTFTPPTANFDHALESSKLMPELAKQFGFNDDSIEVIVEAVKYHDKAGMGVHNETRLLRNADGIDYLGYMAVARDFSRFSNDLKKVITILKQRKEQFLPIIDLPYAKELAAPRVEELEHFISRIEEESFGLYWVY